MPFKGNYKSKTIKRNKTNGNAKKLSEFAKATLGSGNMRHAVQLPKDEDKNEWLAVNTVDFFNEVSLLYGTITEHCTSTSCKEMSAGKKFTFLWADENNKKPVSVSAPEYVEKLMSWVETQLNDEAIFPLQLGTPFPKSFVPQVKVIFKRLFRVYGHMYHSHFQEVKSVGVEAHLNTCFKHFIFFVNEFSLIEDKYLEPLDDLIKAMLSAAVTPQDEGVPGGH